VIVLLLGAAAGLGLLLAVLAMTPRPAKAPLPAADGPGRGGADGSEDAGTVQDAARRAARRIGRDLQAKSELAQDARMVGRSLETHAVHKLAGLVLGAAVVAACGVFANAVFALALPLPVVGAAAAAGGLGGWFLPDSILRTEADKERVLFQQVTESWLELVAQLVTAGADTFGALAAAASYSRQPGFVVIRDALRASAVGGEAPWTGLRRLADERRLRFLDPFCSALELAGTTGAGSRQAILAQVEAARSKAMLEADAVAASAGEKMGAPLALIGAAFMILMGYPPMAGILDTATIGGL
jgi:Flp pilus assembly protein TadB